MYDPFAPAPDQMTSTAVSPTGALSPNNALAPTMMPPQMQQRGPNDPAVQAIMAQRPGHDAFHLAMRNAPDEAARLAISNQWHNELNQWHQSLTAARQQYHQQQNPDWQSTNPIQVTPFTTTFASAAGPSNGPQTPNTRFPINPGAPPTLGQAPPTNDWRALRTPKPSSYGI